MEEKILKQEELLKILLKAYQKGETSINMTTKELLQLIEIDLKKVYS